MPEDRTTKAVLRKRDEYRRMAPLYKFYQESYEGGEGYISSNNLHPHRFEDEEDFEERKKRAYFYNYSAPIANIYNSFLFRDEAERDFGDLDQDELFQMFLENADKQGNSYLEVVRDDSLHSSINGIYFWLIDKPTQQASTRGDELEGEIFPYIVRINPLDVWDWGVDEFGKLLWIKIREVSSDPEDFVNEDAPIEKFRIWDREKWRLYEIRMEGKDRKAVLVDEAEHPIGEVPVIPVCHYKNKPMVGLSLLSDIAYINRGVFNWCSLLDEILYRQTFSQLTFPEDPANPLGDQVLGSARGVGFPPDARVAPHFISPDPAQAQVFMTQIENGVNEIYRIATLRGAVGVVEQSSGVARSYDFILTNNNLSTKALNVQEAEIKALVIWARWQEISEPNVRVEYPRDFEVEAMREEIAKVIEGGTVIPSRTFNQIQKMNLVKRLLPRLDEETLEKIKAEITASGSQPSAEDGRNLQDQGGQVIRIQTEQNG